MSETDPFGGLTGNNRDAYAAILNTLTAYGLESLAPTVFGYIQQGYTSDTISVLLPETTAYKTRFAANTTRKAAGLPVLSPAEYLAVETSYRKIMTAAGLPGGFYDRPDDFTSWIAGDVSPVEVQARVDTAASMVDSIDPSAKAAFGQWYSTGDMVAYSLDRTRATTVLDRQWRAAQLGGAAKDAALAIDQATAERIAGTDVSISQARAGMGQAAQLNAVTSKLSTIYGGDYTAADALAETFLDSTPSTAKRQRLASQERGMYGGSAKTAAAALDPRKAGRV